MSFKPEDLIPDSADFADIQGTRIRKGSFAALLANAEILCSDTASIEEKTAAKIAFSEIIPNLVVIGLHKHIWWKNSELQHLMEQAIK
jgi:hypothetical protein